MYIANTMKTDIVTITPEIAAEILPKNVRNRNISAQQLNKVRHALTSGQWKLNGEAIKIAKDGTLLDGQHRLTACVQTGIPFQTLLIYGLDKDTQDTMDTGKSRGPADVLSINGYKNSALLAAITLGIIRSEKWNMRTAFTTGGNYPVTAREILHRVQEEPTITELCSVAQAVRKAGLAGKISGVLYHRFAEIDKQDADYFFARLSEGDGLERGNPILTLREHLFSLKNANHGTLNPVFVSAIVIKAWNKFRRGEQCFQLRFKTGGANPEKYPVIE